MKQKREVFRRLGALFAVAQLMVGLSGSTGNAGKAASRDGAAQGQSVSKGGAGAPKNDFIRVFGALCAVALVVVGCTGSTGDTGKAASRDGAAQSQSVSTGGAEAPESDAGGGLQSFTAQTLDGGTFTQENLKEKDLTIINFWATFCGPCLQEMPDLSAFAKALPDNVQLVTVCLDGTGAEDTVESILREAGYDGVTMLSGDGDFESLCGEILYIPTTVFVDSEGNLVGDEIIGGQEDLAESFLAAANAAMRAGGKAEISLAE